MLTDTACHGGRDRLNARRRQRYAESQGRPVRPWVRQTVPCACGRPAVSRGRCKPCYARWYWKQRIIREVMGRDGADRRTTESSQCSRD